MFSALLIVETLTDYSFGDVGGEDVLEIDI